MADHDERGGLAGGQTPGRVSVSWNCWFGICMSSIANVSVMSAPVTGWPLRVQLERE